jgi:hypothetical protein
MLVISNNPVPIDFSLTDGYDFNDETSYVAVYRKGLFRNKRVFSAEYDSSKVNHQLKLEDLIDGKYFIQVYQKRKWFRHKILAYSDAFEVKILGDFENLFDQIQILPHRNNATLEIQHSSLPVEKKFFVAVMSSLDDNEVVQEKELLPDDYNHLECPNGYCLLEIYRQRFGRSKKLLYRETIEMNDMMGNNIVRLNFPYTAGYTKGDHFDQCCDTLVVASVLFDCTVNVCCFVIMDALTPP